MERRGAGAGRRVGLPRGVKSRARIISGRVLVRGIASPAEEVRGHENGDHHHQGRQDDFNMHFCSHPGSMADSVVKPTRHAFSAVCLAMRRAPACQCQP